MVSVMAIESDVFGSCIGEIDVSVEVENSEVWLCCGWKYLGYILAGKVAVEAGDGARYRKPIGACWGWLQN